VFLFATALDVRSESQCLRLPL